MIQESSQRKLVTIVNAARLGKDLSWVKGLWKEYFSINSENWIEPKDWNDAKKETKRYLSNHRGESVYVQSISGDGGYNAVANAFLERNIPHEHKVHALRKYQKGCNDNVLFGFIPAGSGNDTTRTFGLESITSLRGESESVIEWYLEPFKESMNVDSSEFVTSMDVGEVFLHTNKNKTRHFLLNTLDLGLIAEINNNTPVDENGEKDYLKTSRNLWWNKLLNGGFNVEFLYQNGPNTACDVNRKGISFSVQNGQYFGNNLCINPEGDVSDGLMEAFVLRSPGPLRFFRDMYQLKKGNGNHLNSKNIVYKKNFESIGGGFSSPQEAHIDGEILPDTYNRVSVHVKPQALQVVTAYRNK